MTRALPVVGVDAGALRDRVPRGLGCLGPVDDAGGMAESIVRAAAQQQAMGAGRDTSRPLRLGQHVSHALCLLPEEACRSCAAPALGRRLTRQHPIVMPGDRWCLCAARWQQAGEAGVGPPVVLDSTNDAALELIDLALLRRHALDLV